MSISTRFAYGWSEELEEYGGEYPPEWTMSYRVPLSNGQALELQFYIDYEQEERHGAYDVEVGMGVVRYLGEWFGSPDIESYANGTPAGPGGLEVYPLAVAGILEGIDRTYQRWPDKNLRFVVHGATMALHKIYRRTLSRHGFWETESRPHDGQKTIMVFQREES